MPFKNAVKYNSNAGLTSGMSLGQNYQSLYYFFFTFQNKITCFHTLQSYAKYLVWNQKAFIGITKRYIYYITKNL